MNSLFKADPGHIFDFADRSAGDIFNSSILPTVNGLSEQADPGGLEEAARRREAQLQQDLRSDTFRQQQDDDFMQSVLSQRSAPSSAVQSAPAVGGATADFSEFEVPLPPAAPETLPKSAVPAQSFASEKLKLSNYGYASDSSPDYNSNVRRVGHAENPLETGVSAALTKSLAKRYGLKTGDFFEIQTADGGVMKRRYDDTVPDKYKGKPLPETVDLYDLKGSNKFGGTVIGFRKL